MYKGTKIKIPIGEETSKGVEINKGVRQERPLSFIRLNLYMNMIIQEWVKAKPQGVQLEGNNKLETILFADDQVVLDDLQRNVHARENNKKC